MSGTRDERAISETLGACPHCGAVIPSEYVLIEYRTSEGWPKLFAECPDCVDVVHPQ